MFLVAVLVLLAADLFIVIGYLYHWSSISKDILADEKKKLIEWAETEAEVRAEERVREILNGIQYTKRVELVNESDIYWG